MCHWSTNDNWEEIMGTQLCYKLIKYSKKMQHKFIFPLREYFLKVIDSLRFKTACRPVAHTISVLALHWGPIALMVPCLLGQTREDSSPTHEDNLLNIRSWCQTWFKCPSFTFVTNGGCGQVIWAKLGGMVEPISFFLAPLKYFLCTGVMHTFEGEGGSCKVVTRKQPATQFTFLPSV